MSTLSLKEKRWKFARMLPRLIDEAHALGYEVAIDHVKRCATCSVGHPLSVHKVGLAVDLILYSPEGEWLQGEAARIGHTLLSDFWDTLGGAPRIEKDLRHYSLYHNGMR